jgi:heat shock protein HtpX
MSNLLRRILRGGGGRGTGGRKGNPLALVVLLAWLVTLVLAPILSSLLSMAVSRKREFLADATGAQLNRDPLALASALEKIDASSAPTTHIMKGSAHMCIVDPAERRVTEREGFLADLLASHPPMRLRMARLRTMAYQEGKSGPA